MPLRPSVDDLGFFPSQAQIQTKLMIARKNLIYCQSLPFSCILRLFKVVNSLALGSTKLIQNMEVLFLSNKIYCSIQAKLERFSHYFSFNFNLQL